MDVSVVIPNYNGAKYILRCLEHVYNQTFSSLQIIVVDNNSDDDSCSLIENKYPDVHILKLEQNLGFSAAVNLGIKIAAAPYVLLLNNDAFIESDFIEILYHKINQDGNNIFSCCGKMMKYHDQNIIEGTGDFYNLLGWAYQRGNGEAKSQYNQDGEVFSCCAGATLYRKSIFNEIGYFDEDFFAYLEDIDLGFRSKLYGYNNWYCHKAICFHVGSATTGGGYNEFKVKLSVRNNIYLMYKNLKNIQLLFNIIPFSIGWIIRYFYFRKIGLGSIYLESSFEGLKTLKKYKTKRRKYGHVWTTLKLQIDLSWNTLQYMKYYIKRKHS